MTTSTPIPDDDTIAIQFAVSGLIDNNLASPTQGICGVEIDFMHEYLGDLTISLISPSGTIVQLIGPATTATFPTNLSRWNIEFLPCGTPASPDAGFTPTWSNLQAWQALTPYSGTYHPQSGCLENFNSGPANGIWQFVIEDHDQFQLGSIASLTLIFCNPAGLQCTECNPNAGMLSPTLFSICTGDNVQSSDIAIDFGGNEPLPSLYGYEFLMLSGNNILQNGASFSITPPAGLYSICGLNYLLSDSSVIGTLIATNDYTTLSQAVENGIVCGQLTSSCVTLEVNAKPDTIEVWSDLCNGEVFSFGGQDYFAEGIYYQVHDGPGLCDTVFQIRIDARNLSVVINMPDTLTCGNGTVDLLADVSGASGPFIYQWATINGNIISAANSNTITLDQAGQYVVEVTDGLCTGIGSATVFADQGYPQVYFEGGTITCFEPIININPIYIPSGGNILWSGPSGFSSVQPDIAVSIPGTYFLNVTNQSGCTTSRSVDIGIDTTTFPIDIVPVGKNCQDSLMTLGTTFPERLIAWQWTGPNAFSTNNWRAFVTDPGIYSLTGTFPNGCTRSGTFLFDGDFLKPDILVSPGDTLNCNEIIPINVFSNSPGATYSWNGPQGFYSALSGIMINQEGSYIGTVIAPNGCTNSADVNIVRGDDVFNFQIVVDTLTCAQTLVTIGVMSPDADIFQWLNYSGPDANQSFIEVTAAGTYTVMMTDTNTGCTVTTEVLVSADYTYPHFNYSTDTITCDDPVAELNFVPLPGYTYSSVYWELPDLTVVQGPTLMSGLPGEHRLYGISETNGCVGLWLIHIPFDTLPPFLILETDTLICSDTVQIVSQTLDSMITYQWSGAGLVGIVGETVSVNEPGWYHLSASGENGCPAEYDILVDSNFKVPDYNLMVDSLRCDRPALLSAEPIDPPLSYGWFNSDGLLISSDSFVLVNQPGKYTFQIMGLNQCVAYDTVIMDPLHFPVISISSDTFTCVESLIPVSLQVDISQYTLAWLDISSDTFSHSANILVTQPGPFIASVSGLNACESRDTIFIPYDTLPPFAIIQSFGEIRCQNKDVILDGFASSPAPLNYSWTANGGSIQSNPSLAQIDVKGVGIYVLEVQRLDNGCSDMESLQLTEHSDAITLAILDIMDPECSGDKNGSIRIAGVEGGVPPMRYQIDGGGFQSSAVFSGLDAGTYLLSITDAENCLLDTLVRVEPTLDFSVDAGPDVEIRLGESIQLSGTTDLDISAILSDQWVSQGSTLCTNCLLFEDGPMETVSYTYQVTSSTGCIKADEVVVYVIEKGKYFVANIFSPNGDGINDEIRLHAAPGIERVLQWVIFDRWGNAVFAKQDFGPADTSVFWNGQTKEGEYPNPGVFPYMLEIQLINGKIEVFNGEITLVR